MIQGLYSAANGLVALESRQEAIANNIANAATAGYKRHQPVQFGFYQEFQTALRSPGWHRTDTAPGGGVKVIDTHPNLSNGIMQSTGNDLHVALQGPGYLVVDTEGGERYTRTGDLTIDADGELATATGYKLQSVSGRALTIGQGALNIGTGGAVAVDGQPVGQLRLVEFAEPHRLLREGDNLFAASAEVEEQRAEAADTRVVQGRLEMSNVNLPVELGSMMLGLRAYEANQRVITTIDATMSRLIDQVAMPV